MHVEVCLLECFQTWEIENLKEKEEATPRYPILSSIIVLGTAAAYVSVIWIFLDDLWQVLRHDPLMESLKLIGLLGICYFVALLFVAVILKLPSSLPDSYSPPGWKKDEKWYTLLLDSAMVTSIIIIFAASVFLIPAMAVYADIIKPRLKPRQVGIQKQD